MRRRLLMGVLIFFKATIYYFRRLDSSFLLYMISFARLLVGFWLSFSLLKRGRGILISLLLIWLTRGWYFWRRLFDHFWFEYECRVSEFIFICYFILMRCSDLLVQWSRWSYHNKISISIIDLDDGTTIG